MSADVNFQFAPNFKWQQRYEPEIVAILRAHAWQFVSFRNGTPAEDMERGIDMVVYMEGGTLACRLRREAIGFRDLTIRKQSWQNGKTELAKLQAGIAPRWYFYGWVLRDRVAEWMLVDMHKLAASGLLDKAEERTNKDQRTKFIAIPAAELYRHKCLLAYELPNLSPPPPAARDPRSAFIAYHAARNTVKASAPR